MTNMIERVAKAILAEHTESMFDIFHARVYARAAIAAMREPTDEMVRQCMVYTQCMDTGHTRDDAEGAWQAMIDAALECSTKPDGQ
jgi:hypothetical protein